MAKHNIALWILRLAVGGLMLPHGLHKLQHGTGGVASMLASAGLPTFLQYGVIVGEVIAPIFLILGVLTIPSAWIVAFTMVMSIFLAFSDKIFTFNQFGGLTPELNLLFLAGAVAIALLGPGKYALGKGKFA